MSGDLARINREIQEIENIINTYSLEAKRVVVFITPEQRDEIYRNIVIRSNAADRLHEIEGELNQKTKPSGPLVKNRDNWIMKLKYVRERIDNLKIAQNCEINVLKHNNFPIPENKLH